MEYEFSVGEPISEQEALAHVAGMGWHGLAFDDVKQQDEVLHWHEFASIAWVISGTGSFADEHGASRRIFVLGGERRGEKAEHGAEGMLGHRRKGHRQGCTASQRAYRQRPRRARAIRSRFPVAGAAGASHPYAQRRSPLPQDPTELPCRAIE